MDGVVMIVFVVCIGLYFLADLGAKVQLFRELQTLKSNLGFIESELQRIAEKLKV